MPATATSVDSVPDSKADQLAVLLENVQLTLSSEAGDVNILRGIDLEVGQGEAIGIVGPSGGGKSTMMMVIAGLERASSGTVETAGVELNPLSEDDLALFRRERLPSGQADFNMPCVRRPTGSEGPSSNQFTPRCNDVISEWLRMSLCWWQSYLQMRPKVCTETGTTANT